MAASVLVAAGSHLFGPYDGENSGTRFRFGGLFTVSVYHCSMSARDNKNS
jgi:hypothetical protein